MATTKEFNISSNAVTVLNQTADAAENTAKGFTSAKAELRALQQQLLQMDATSEEFKKASARAAELKDNIGDLSAEISANAGNAFEGLSNNIGLFSSRLMDLDLKGAGQALSGMGTAVRRIDFKTIKEEVGGLVKGLGNLASSVVSNPFFLTVGVLAAIAYNWKEIATWSKQTSIEQQNLAKVTNDLNEATKQELAKGAENIAQIEILTQRVQDHNLTEKERRKALSDLEDMYPAYFSNINGDINDTEALNAAKVKLIDNIKKEAKANAAKALLEQEYAKKIALEQELAAKKGKLTQEQFDKAVETARFNSQTLFKETNQNISEWYNGTEGIGKAALDLEESNQRIAYLEQEASSAVLATIDTEVKAIHEKTKAAKTAREKEQDEKERLQKEADDKELDRRKKLDAAMMAEDERMASISYEDLKAREKKKGDARLITEMQIHANLTALRAAQSQKELDDLRQLEALKAETRLRQVGESLNALSALNEAFTKKGQQQSKKQFQIQKALNLASAVVDTYGGINRALNDKTMPSTTARIIQASIVGAMGLANVLKISKTEYGNATAPSGTNMSTGGSGGDNGTTAPSPANFAFLQNQPGQQQPPLQAYVVSSQVSSNLEAQQLIQNQSKLGG